MVNTKVITVTLNPSLDRTMITQYLAVGYHNRAQESTRLDPSGHGVNIARALTRLGCATHAIILLGDDATGRAYKALIEKEKFKVTALPINERTRSSTIILDNANQTETQITEESTPINEEDIRQVAETLSDLITIGDIVVFAGSLPKGAPLDTYARLTASALDTGAEVAIVVAGDPLEAALNARPQLAALTQIEAEAFFNYPIRAQADVTGAARKLRELGAGKALIVMEERAAAVLVTGNGEWVAEMPLRDAGTTSGLWDALIAGFVAYRLDRRPDHEALHFGAASAAYTGSQVGSEFGSRDVIEKMKEQIRLDDLNELAPRLQPDRS